MLVAHIGDIHLGCPGRQDAVRASLDFLLGDLAATRPDVILVAGDVFDALSTIDSRNQWSTWAVAAANIAPLVAVRGNHDRPGDLQISNLLGARHAIRVVEEPTVVMAGGARILCYPHMEKALLAAEGTIGESNARAAVAMTGQIRALAEGAAYDGPTILLAHLTVRGARMSCGRIVGDTQPAQREGGESRVAQAITVGVDDLVDLGVDYAALGHIHAAQALHPRVAYAGSICRANRGEAREDKSWYAVDVERGRPPRIETRRVPCRPMVTITASWTPRGWTAKGADDVPADAEVWVRLTAPEERAADLAQAKLEAAQKYPGARVDGVLTAETRVRSEAAGQAATPEDHLEAFWLATARPEPVLAGAALDLLTELEMEVAQ